MNANVRALSSAFGKSRIPFGRPTRQAWIAAGAIGAGAVLMYFLGAGRAGLNATVRAIGNRALGAWHSGKALFRSAGPDESDTRLAQRLDAAITRSVSHPRAILASVRHGAVTLSGPILRAEINRLIAEVEQLPGVRKVLARLTVHDPAGRMPALPDEGEVARRYGRAAALLQERWSPASRLLAGMAGGVLLATAWRTRRPGNALLAALGASLMARAASSRSVAELAGRGGRRMHVHKSLHISAPVQQVFEFWRRAENFPGVMRHVLEVRRESENRTHWKVAGPAGIPVEWTSEITDLVAPELIAWRSVQGSAISHAGSAHFSEDPAGGTRVEIRLAYLPPAGAAGRAVARLFGSDPKSELDADLARLKSAVEAGQASLELPRRAESAMPDGGDTAPAVH